MSSRVQWGVLWNGHLLTWYVWEWYRFTSTGDAHREQCCLYSPSPSLPLCLFSLFPSLLPHPLSPHSPPLPPYPSLSPLTPPSLLYTLAWQTWPIPVENATMALVTIHQQPVSAILFMKGSIVTVSQVSDTRGLTGTAWYSVMWQEVHVGVCRLLQRAYRLLTTWPCLDMPSLYTAMYTVNEDILLHKLPWTPPHFMHNSWSLLLSSHTLANCVHFQYKCLEFTPQTPQNAVQHDPPTPPWECIATHNTTRQVLLTVPDSSSNVLTLPSFRWTSPVWR